MTRLLDRPTIFLSSTVHDFGDLRSALKDYLELRGCRALASEFTDFPRPLDKHSYDACLEAVEQADIFVLMIGRRVGGWLDESNRISITRAEYRHAYELAKTGRMRLLCLVRSEVFDHRQSVQDLERALKADLSLSAEQRDRLAHHPSRAMDDAGAIISFIDEVSRNVETDAASKGLAVPPIANWVSPFTTFTQVRQALDPLIAHGLTVPQAAGRKALEVQLVQLLRKVVPLIQGTPTNPVITVLRLRRELDIKGDDLNTVIYVPEKRWTSLVHILTFTTGGDVDPTPLLSALGSDLLLKYEPATGSYSQTREYELLAHVVEQARGYAKSEFPDLVEMVKHGRAMDASGTRHVPAALLMKWMHRLLRWVDLIGSARALATSMAGKTLSEPAVVPLSPIVDQEDNLIAEAPTDKQIAEFITGDAS